MLQTWRWFALLWTQFSMMICFKSVCQGVVTALYHLRTPWNGLADLPRSQEETTRHCGPRRNKEPSGLLVGKWWEPSGV